MSVSRRCFRLVASIVLLDLDWPSCLVRLQLVQLFFDFTFLLLSAFWHLHCCCEDFNLELFTLCYVSRAFFWLEAFLFTWFLGQSGFFIHLLLFLLFWLGFNNSKDLHQVVIWRIIVFFCLLFGHPLFPQQLSLSLSLSFFKHSLKSTTAQNTSPHCLYHDCSANLQPSVARLLDRQIAPKNSLQENRRVELLNPLLHFYYFDDGKSASHITLNKSRLCFTLSPELRWKPLDLSKHILPGNASETRSCNRLELAQAFASRQDPSQVRLEKDCRCMLNQRLHSGPLHVRTPSL